MISKKQYVEYLLSTPFNYTCTNLADHLDGVSHDVVNDFLRQERLRPRELWELVRGRIEDCREAFLIIDDSVQDKRYSRFIELVKYQYNGAEHQLVKGIGVVNLVHSNGQDGNFYPIDYRVYAPEIDHKSKNHHFQEMFIQAVEKKAMKARTTAQRVRRLVRLRREFEADSPSALDVLHDTEEQSLGESE
jgi:hypothetical protein